MSESKLKHEAAYLFKNGFIHGIAWSFGATFGFVIVSTILVWVLQALGGLPLIGSWIAGIVESTQQALINRNPIFK